MENKNIIDSKENNIIGVMFINVKYISLLI